MQTLAQTDAPRSPSKPTNAKRATARLSRPLSLFEMLASRVPDIQAPALPRRGQREYLARCRRVYARELVKTGLNRATRRALAKHMRIAEVAV